MEWDAIAAATAANERLQYQIEILTNQRDIARQAEKAIAEAADKAAKRVKELEDQADMHADFMGFMAGELAQFPCCHEDGEHHSTPPMMWPELIACIVKKAVRDAQERVKELGEP